MMLLMSNTQINAYPNWLPPAISVAQLPGSIYPTLMRYAGPKNANILRHQVVLLAGLTDSCTSSKDLLAIPNLFKLFQNYR